jgi:hypothetical protein
MAIVAAAEALPVSNSTPKSLQIAAAVIGNALEWYDFIIFGFLTVVRASCKTVGRGVLETLYEVNRTRHV